MTAGPWPTPRSASCPTASGSSRSPTDELGLQHPGHPRGHQDKVLDWWTPSASPSSPWTPEPGAVLALQGRQEVKEIRPQDVGSIAVRRLSARRQRQERYGRSEWRACLPTCVRRALGQASGFRTARSGLPHPVESILGVLQLIKKRGGAPSASATRRRRASLAHPGIAFYNQPRRRAATSRRVRRRWTRACLGEGHENAVSTARVNQLDVAKILLEIQGPREEMGRAWPSLQLRVRDPAAHIPADIKERSPEFLKKKHVRAVERRTARWWWRWRTLRPHAARRHQAMNLAPATSSWRDQERHRDYINRATGSPPRPRRRRTWAASSWSWAAARRTSRGIRGRPPSRDDETDSAS